MGAAVEVYNELGYGMDFGKKGELESKRFVVDGMHVTTKGSSREHSCTLIGQQTERCQERIGDLGGSSRDRDFTWAAKRP